MKFAIVVATAAMAFSVIAAVQAYAMQDEEIQLPDVAKELAERVEKDQKARHAMIPSQGEGSVPDQELLNALVKIDKENTAWLKEKIDEHGWLGKTLVGEQGAKDAWLLVQHADLDREFQKQCLKLMNEMPDGEVSPINVAYLTDRVLVAEKKPQRFGTQVNFVDGVATVKEVEDPENLDARRKEIGLPPIDEYLKRIESIYKR